MVDGLNSTVQAETTIAPNTPAQSGKSSDQLQDASEAMKLLTAQLQMMQISLAVLSGNAVQAQELAQGALSEVNKVLAENPQSIVGLQTRCAIKNVMEEGTGNSDCAQGLTAVNARIAKYPSEPIYYKQRANLQETLGHKTDALADLI